MPTADILLPEGNMPSNLHLRENVRVRTVTSDLYNICSRLKELHPSLYIIDLEDDKSHCWAIMENCEDRQQRLIFKTAELDSRVLDKINYIMGKPLAERIAILEKLEHDADKKQKEDQLDELYDRFGGQMWYELEKSGFIQRPVSYPKAGIK